MTRRLWIITGGVVIAFAIVIATLTLRNLVGPSAGPEWLLVHSSTSAKIVTTSDDGSLLTLSQPDNSVLMFTDRPERRTALISVDEMMSDWDAWFAGDPPNAALSDGSEDPNFVVMTLSNPRRLANKDLQFNITVDTNEPMNLVSDATGEVHLFIDPPAARLTDFHQAPMSTPSGPTLIPTEGPASWGEPGDPLLIGDLPRAKVGDMGIENETVGPSSD
jgi:hypothetical protein